MNDIDKKLGSIDTAICECEKLIKSHKKSSANMFWLMLLLISLVLGFASGYAYIDGKFKGKNFKINLQNQVEIEKEIKDLNSELKTANETFNKLNAEYRLKLSDYENRSKSGEEDPATLKQLNEKALSAEKIKNAAEERVTNTSKQIEKKSEILNEQKKNANTIQSSFLLPKEIQYGVIGSFILIISVFTSLYRFHLKEMTKNEKYKLGFMRIRVAANNFDIEGFQSEVRESLTANAFEFQSESLFPSKDKQVDSPIPGYPSSDIATAMVNKFMNQVDLVLSPKKSEMSQKGGSDRGK